MTAKTDIEALLYGYNKPAKMGGISPISPIVCPTTPGAAGKESATPAGACPTCPTPPSVDANTYSTTTYELSGLDKAQMSNLVQPVRPAVGGEPTPASPREAQVGEPPPAAGPGDDKAEPVGAAAPGTPSPTPSASPTEGQGGASVPEATTEATPSASLDFSAWTRAKAIDGRMGWQSPACPRLAWWKRADFESLAQDWRTAIRQVLRRGRR